MGIPLRVLIVEDSDRDVVLEVRALEAAGYRVTYRAVDTAAEMKAALAEEAFDAIISDYDLPQFDAHKALVLLKESGLDIPFIIVSGVIGNEAAVGLVRAGAHDYVLKDRLPRLAIAIEQALLDAANQRKLRQAEEALKQNQQQQLQIRDQFLSRMSHELRSPLTSIYQFVTILLDGLAGNLNAEQREYLQITLRNINTLRTMISDLLEVTRAASGKLNIDIRCVYLTELIPSILKTFQLANTKDLLISFDVPGNLPPVCADPDRVQQILDNLLGNAIKCTPEKGGVRVQARVSNRNPGFLCIAVSDTGSGIARSEHKKIFEYLYQAENNVETNHTGLGIGLYICKELVSSHGGRIWVKSRPRRGSTFSFTLPIFSLELQLAPIVKIADPTAHSIALIAVEISHIKKRPLKGKTVQSALQDAWGVLQSCTLPNLVVLFPRVPHMISKEFFFIAACVNQSSAEVLVEQLRDQLARCQSLQDSRLIPKVSFILLEICSKRKGMLAKKLTNKKIADHIEDSMKTILHTRRGLYEWTKGPYNR